MNRRSFFKWLGVAPIAAPLAISATAEEQVNPANGIRLLSPFELKEPIYVQTWTEPIYVQTWNSFGPLIDPDGGVTINFDGAVP